MERAIECAPIPSDISLFDFHIWDFHEKHVCADTPKTIEEVKDASTSELGHLPSQMSDEAIADLKSICLPEVTWRTRVKPGQWSFTLRAADGQLRLGMFGDMFGLFCHSISN